MRAIAVFTLLVIAVIAAFSEAPFVAIVLAVLAFVLVLTDRRR